MTEFFLLSIKWSRRQDKLLTWWCPDGGGYTFRLDGTRKPAGRYPLALVEAKLMHYHNGEDTLAVPCDVVLAASMPLYESTSRAIDRSCPENRVVHWAKRKELTAAAKAWHPIVPIMIR